MSLLSLCMTRMVNHLFTACQQIVPAIAHNLFMDQVWTRIDQELARRRKTWHWLYTALGYSKGRVNNWSRRGIPTGEYQALADLLGKSIDWVARGDDLGGAPDYPAPADKISAIPTTTERVTHTAYPYSVTTLVRAPVVEWARMGEDVSKEPEELHGYNVLEFTPFGAVGRRAKLVPVVDEGLAPRLNVGDMVAIDPDNVTPERGQVTLFRSTVDGQFFLRRYQPLIPPAFEAVDSRGAALDSQRHGLEIIGVRCGALLADI